MSSRNALLVDELSLELVSRHKLVFFGQELRQVPGAIDVATAEPVSSLRNQIHDRVCTQFSSLDEDCHIRR